MQLSASTRSPLRWPAAAIALAATAVAQCTPDWLPGDPLTHVRGAVLATVTWDPDGPGPLPTSLVAGGSFAAGDSGSTSVAAFDGSHWTPLGSLGAQVTRLTVWNGQLVAAAAAPNSDVLWLWNGTAWQYLADVFGSVHALGTYNGALIVGGSFILVSGPVSWAAAQGLARWDGATWSEVGGGVSGDVRALAVYDNRLHVGGTISQVNTATSPIAVGRLAAWNGSSWVPTATFNDTVECLAVRTTTALNGDQLFVGGAFTTCGAIAAQHMARLSKSTGQWTAMAGGLPGTTVRGLFANNGVAFGVELTAVVDSTAALQLAWRWNGTAWSALGSFDPPAGSFEPTCLSYFAGQYVAGSSYTMNALRRYDGSSGWPILRSAGVADPVYAVDASTGDLVLGGAFSSIAGVTMNGIAHGSFGAWQPLGSGIESGAVVRTVVRLGNGDVIAGGTFASAGGVPAANIARWNGSAWSPLGGGCNGTVYALCLLANGDVVAGGEFTVAGSIAAYRLARWNGSTWSALGSGLGAAARAVAQLANGDLVVGGDFLVAGPTPANHIARWNGSGWSPMGNGLDQPVFALAILHGGTVAAGGSFLMSGPTSTPNVALWNGSTWAAPPASVFRPNQVVHTLTVLPDGDLVAGGLTFFASATLTSPAIQTNLARWNGSTWSSLDVHGTDVAATALDPVGELIAGGDFDLAGSIGAGNVAHLVSPCPAHATPYAFGCAGTGGPDVLTAESLPWTGNTLREIATGMPDGIAVVATGFLPTALLLDSLFPQALPGCFLVVMPDWIDAVPAVGGVAHYQLPLADSVALAGLVFYQQVVPFEIGPAGDISAITASNGLVLRVGTL